METSIFITVNIQNGIVTGMDLASFNSYRKLFPQSIIKEGDIVKIYDGYINEQPDTFKVDTILPNGSVKVKKIEKDEDYVLVQPRYIKSILLD